MKLSIFNRPHLGVRSGIDIYAIASGFTVVASGVVLLFGTVLGG